MPNSIAMRGAPTIVGIGMALAAVCIALESWRNGSEAPAAKVESVQAKVAAVESPVSSAVIEDRCPITPFSDPESQEIEVAAWAEYDPGAAAAWSQRITDPEFREKLQSIVATTWADYDPISASKFLLETVPPGQTQQNAVMGILQRLAFKDFAAAEEWAALFPEALGERAKGELERISSRQKLESQPFPN